VFGYLFVCRDNDHYFEIGLRVGILVGTRGRKEDKFVDEMRIARIVDVRHFIQQLLAAKITDTLQDFLKYVKYRKRKAMVKREGRHF
jgi:hypothetical protein